MRIGMHATARHRHAAAQKNACEEQPAGGDALLHQLDVGHGLRRMSVRNSTGLEHRCSRSAASRYDCLELVELRSCDIRQCR